MICAAIFSRYCVYINTHNPYSSLYGNLQIVPQLTQGEDMKEYKTDKVVPRLKIRTGAKRNSTYVYQWSEAGRVRRISLGRVGAMTLMQARTIAREHDATLASGGSPANRQTALRQNATLADVWSAWWADHGSSLKDAKTAQGFYTNHLCEYHNKLLGEISNNAISATHRRITKDGKATTANRVLQLLNQLFRFAMFDDRFDCERNPCEGVRRNTERARKRYLDADERQRFFTIIQQRAPQSPAGAAFLMLLITTGARKSEIANMRWRDLRGDKVVLQEHKTERLGERVIHLSQSALEIIRDLPRTDLDAPIVGIKSPRGFFARCCEDAGIKDFRMHDLRHSFASIGVTAGMTLHEIGELLGHASPQTTKRYAHLMEDAAQQRVNLIGDLLAKKPAGEASQAAGQAEASAGSHLAVAHQRLVKPGDAV